MKAISISGLVIGFVVFACLGASSHRVTFGDIQADTIQAKRIVVKTSHGECRIGEHANGGVGMVLSSDGKTCAVIESHRHGANIHLTNGESEGAPVAISLDAKGEPWVQCHQDGKVKFIELRRLLGNRK